jgi:alpha-1,2-mannosyltransferase
MESSYVIEPQIKKEPARLRGFRDAVWLNRSRLGAYPKLFLIAYAVSVAGWLLMGHGLTDRKGKPIGADFVEFWSASNLTLGRTPASAYKQSSLWAAERAAVASKTLAFTPFPYPPPCLLMIAPLASLPYLWSLAVWSAVGLLLYLWVLRRITHDATDSVWLTLAFPGAVINLMNGQNGFITLALLGSGVLYLEQSPILAGVLFGISSYKPQFVTLVPLFLIVTRRWRTLAVFGLSVVLLYGASLVAFGGRTWTAFLSSLTYTQTVVLEQGGTGWAKTQSIFGAARMSGLGIEGSYLLHGLVAVAAVAVASWIWRHTDNIALQGSALITAALLFTPHLMPYDLVQLSLPIAWLAVDGLRSDFLPWDKNLLALSWVYPLLTVQVAQYGVALGWAVPLMLLLLALRRVRYEGAILSPARPAPTPARPFNPVLER